MVPKHLGIVDSEDGLLLIGDGATLQSWRGNDLEQDRFDQIALVLSQSISIFPVSIAHSTSVLWNMKGPGTADIFYEEKSGNVIFVRTWLNDLENIEIISTLSSIPYRPENVLGEFIIRSNFLMAMSPVENGSCIYNDRLKGYSFIERNMLSKTSGFSIPNANGRYLCFHDQVKNSYGEADRCFIIRVD